MFRCIDKVFMEEITEWDTEYTCHHSYSRRCAKSLSTTYIAAQVRFIGLGLCLVLHCDTFYSHGEVTTMVTRMN